ncbi:hypothetical protein EOA27_09320 [Mesorhizobium sp. M2A.F.Ca.ET.037.01.1.1]|nr:MULTISPECIES: hypothetical protein [unclassified Mesorhizobium]RUX20169.1 hypothetical protein EOA27_09320 [Mesorhizobium sp. M2A.F.Ca.ET.037.01.1.1]RUY02256.1 hypothetical protein EOA25_21725 [Mesorhizobium sp. M2A.F.Ca.ET.040.01.1.1]TIV16391.1 MAG: hypothetical protein E5V95_22435 [Mesorhizobium sp.]
MVTTRDGWEMFAGPVILVGELPSISDKDIGASTLSAIRAHVSGVPDEIVDKVLLNRSASRFGFRSYNSFLWKSRQMSVDQQGEDKFKLIPYAKVTEKVPCRWTRSCIQQVRPAIWDALFEIALNCVANDPLCRMREGNDVKVRVSKAEEARIDRVIQAAVSGSWEEFAELTDEPFPNDASMREQFEDSAPRLQRAGGTWEMTSGIGIVPEDGTRVITVMIKALPTVDIVLTLHSTSEKDDSAISIWTFFQQLNWDD